MRAQVLQGVLDQMFTALGVAHASHGDSKRRSYRIVANDGVSRCHALSVFLLRLPLFLAVLLLMLLLLLLLPLLPLLVLLLPLLLLLLLSLLVLVLLPRIQSTHCPRVCL